MVLYPNSLQTTATILDAAPIAALSHNLSDAVEWGDSFAATVHNNVIEREEGGRQILMTVNAAAQ